MKHFSSNKIICWQITRHCNRRCVFCVSQSSPEEKHPELNPVPTLERLKYLGTKKISFSGGEPLLFPNLQRTVKIALDMGFKQVLTTNGDMILNTSLELLKCFEYIKLSFYGNEEVHDSLMGSGHYKKLITVVRWLTKKGINVGANYLLSEQSGFCLRDFFNDFKGLLDNILIQTYIPTKNDEIDKTFYVNEAIAIVKLRNLLENNLNNFHNGIKIHNNSKTDYCIILNSDGCFILNQTDSLKMHILGNLHDDFLVLPNGKILSATDTLAFIWRERILTKSIIPVTVPS